MPDTALGRRPWFRSRRAAHRRRGNRAISSRWVLAADERRRRERNHGRRPSAVSGNVTPREFMAERSSFLATRTRSVDAATSPASDDAGATACSGSGHSSCRSSRWSGAEAHAIDASRPPSATCPTWTWLGSTHSSPPAPARRAGGRERTHPRPRCLERLDLLRQRRRGDVQALGRTPEVQLLGDRDEVAQLAQFHAARGYADC